MADMKNDERARFPGDENLKLGERIIADLHMKCVSRLNEIETIRLFLIDQMHKKKCTLIDGKYVPAGERASQIYYQVLLLGQEWIYKVGSDWISMYRDYFKRSLIDSMQTCEHFFLNPSEVYAYFSVPVAEYRWRLSDDLGDWLDSDEVIIAAFVEKFARFLKAGNNPLITGVVELYDCHQWYKKLQEIIQTVVEL